MKPEEFDRRFKNDESVLPYLDVEEAKKVEQETRRINVDFPVWMIEMMDREAKRIGITRQSLIKVWIAEKLENTSR